MARLLSLSSCDTVIVQREQGGLASEPRVMTPAEPGALRCNPDGMLGTLEANRIVDWKTFLQVVLDLISIQESDDQLGNNAVFCPGFQKGRVPSEKGTLARWTDRQKGTLVRWTDRQKGTLARWTEEKGHN